MQSRTRFRNALLVALATSLAACASDPEMSSAEKTPLEPATAIAQAPDAPKSATRAETSASASMSAAIVGASTAAGASAAPATSASPTAAAPSIADGDRIYSKARFVWIQPGPYPSKGWIGYLTLGGSVRLKGTKESAKVAGAGCDAWYAVEPQGYVCLDSKTTTLDPTDREYIALREGAANTASPYPYEYGESLGAPRYATTPTESEQQRIEWDLDKHREKLAELSKDPKSADPKYVGIDLTRAGVPMPEWPTFGPIVREARDYVAPGSTIAWSHAFDLGDRTFLETSDHALVPKDRVRPYPKTSFHGVMLEGETKLPIAFFRKQDRPKLKRDGEAFVETGDSFARLSWVMLTGASEEVKGETFLETRESGIWVREKDAAVADKRGPVPYRTDETPDGRRTWVDISVLGGTMVAYENERPVFATLISAGRGGIPFRGRDPVSTASTPTGSFRVDGKFKTATMVSSTDSSIVHSEVQYVQNFHGPHALHGAYWHDDWGELKSGGCVNLSPRDSAWLFGWSDPQLPEDWFGIRSIEAFGVPTRVVVRP